MILLGTGTKFSISLLRKNGNALREVIKHHLAGRKAWNRYRKQSDTETHRWRQFTVSDFKKLRRQKIFLTAMKCLRRSTQACVLT
jgi:hypothetical protein